MMLRMLWRVSPPASNDARAAAGNWGKIVGGV
jgi:hypothetical protein